MSSLPDQIRTISEPLGIRLAESQYEQLALYAETLWDWNERMNLTRHTTPELFVQRDVFDSYQLSRLLREGEEVLDLGTGGGVPGILLKILRPDLQVTLSDSVGKKAEAVAQIADTLAIDAVVVAGRAEGFLGDERVDAVVARAVGPLKKLLVMLQEHWLATGRLLAIKGPRWVDERQEARTKGLLQDLELRREVEYEIPETGAKSVILKVWPRSVPEVVIDQPIEPGPRG